jgi:hypothetical protein
VAQPVLLEQVNLAPVMLLFCFRHALLTTVSVSHVSQITEGKALEYYWWFILITAFTGSSIATTVINTVQNGQLQDSATNLLIVVGNTSKNALVSGIWIKLFSLTFSCLQKTLQFLPSTALYGSTGLSSALQ